MTLRAIPAVAALTALAVLPAQAHAVLPSGNIVPNGDAEAGPAATDSSTTQPVPNWTPIPNFTAVMYGVEAFPTTAQSAAIGGGRNFFAGGPDNGFSNESGAIQEIDISSAAPEIDAGNVQATMTADIGGFDAQDDSAEAAAVFSTSGGATFNGRVALDPASAAERGGATGFVRRSACTTITSGARVVYVTLLMRRTAGFYNDGYIDNIDLRLSNAPCPAAELPPPVENPEPRVNANAEPTRGRVLVKQPGSDTFVELSDARSIPIGSEIDASKGAIQLETAANTSGDSQTGEFYDGRFVVTQTAGSRPTTDLRVTGRIDKCAGTAKQGVRAAARRRGLWGNTRRGRYRTRGRFATATVRGTIWQTTDTCDTTTVRVRQGTVTVRDLAKRRNIRLKAPRRYTARRRAR